MRGAAEAIKAGRQVGPLDLLGGSARAVQEDIGGREVAEAAGLEGTRAGVTGLALEIGLDPLWMLAPAKLARAARLPQLVRSAMVQRGAQAVAQSGPGQLTKRFVVDPIGKNLVTDYGKPAAYVDLAEEHYRAVAGATEAAMEMGKRIAVLPAVEQRAVREVMEAGSDAGRSAALARLAESGGDASRVGPIAQEAMQRDIALGQQLVDTGLMSEQTFSRWAGRHVRREYEKYETPLAYIARLAKRDPEAAAKAEAAIKAQSGFAGPTASLRERLAFLKERKDIPEDMRREMGEILEAAHPVAKGQALAGRAVETRRFFQQTANKFGRKDAAPGYAHVGDSPSLGPLAGKYFPQAIADDLKRAVDAPEEARRLWKRGVGWWKYGKVVLNPATHARNMVSNYLLASMAGLSPFRPYRYAQAARSILTKDEWFQEAKGAGSFLLDTFAGTELPKLLETADSASGLQRGLASLGRIVNAPGQLYQFEEHLFKMALYIDKRKLGEAPKVAAKAAEEGLFNYRRVPRFIDNLRRTGVVPFVTFPYKAIPATARTLMNRPATINRMGNVFRTFEDRKGPDLRPVLREYMRDGWMQLPGKDADGRTRFLNLGYILPFGDIGELATLGGFAGRGGATAGILSSPPMQVAAAVLTGRDPFTDQPIGDKYGGWLAYWRRFIAPPWLGGGASTEVAAAFRGDPVNPLSRRAEPRTVSQALWANIAGVRITPLDLPEERQRRLEGLAYEARDIRSDIRRYQRAEKLTQEERDEHLATQMVRLRELVRSATELQELVLPETTPRGRDPIASALGEAVASERAQ